MKISRKQKEFLCIIAVFLLFVVVISLLRWEEISSDSLFVKSDGITYHWSKVFLKSSLKNGEIPLWNPYFAGGYAFMADVQQSVFSIFNLWFFMFEDTFAFNTFHILQMVIAGFSMFLLLHEETQDLLSSVVIGFVFSFSTILGGYRIEHTPIITTVALFPLIFYFIIKLKNTSQIHWLWLSAMVMAVQFYSGFTQIVLYFNIVVFVYLLFVLKYLNVKLKEGCIIVIQWGGLYLLLLASQLLPTIQLIRASGRDKISWELFSVLSYDFRILLTMFLPQGYKNMVQSFDMYSSSGIDIEIYIGIICMVFLCYILAFQWKKREIRILIALWLGSFLYGLFPNIPYMGKLVYYIPILNSFRVNARSLPIFIFLSLFLTGIGLSNVRKKEELLKIIKSNIVFCVLLVVVMLSTLSIFSQDIFQFIPENQAYYNDLKSGMIIAVVLSLACMMFLVIYYNWNKERIRIATIIVLGIIVLMDVNRFSSIPTDKKIVKQSYSSPIENMELKEKVLQTRKDGKRIFIPIVSEGMHDGRPLSNFSRFGHLGKDGTLLYNGAITFLDKKLDYWMIKETVFYPQFTQMLKSENGLVSMLGIKYILDEWGQDLNFPVMKENGNKTKKWSKQDIELPRETPAVYSIKVDWLEPEKSYLIEVNTTEDIPVESVYVDFYGQNYDFIEQDSFLEKTGDGLYQAIVTTQEIPEEDVYFRIIALVDNDTIFRDINIYEVQTENKYARLTYGDISLYENEAARAILYIPDQVIGIHEFGINWKEDGLQHVDRNSYIELSENAVQVLNGETQISDINIKNNSVSAHIVSKEDTFVNHAQLYYPGWKAFVDGKETRIYNVNNLIQGIYVPQGEHHIEFRFDPLDVKVGAGLTIIGIAFFIILMKKSREVSLKREVEI